MQNDKNLKLKFYLRGVATGIALSATLLSITYLWQGDKAVKEPPTGQPSIASNESSSDESKSEEIKTSETPDPTEETKEANPTSETESSNTPESTEETGETQSTDDTAEQGNTEETQSTEHTEESSSAESGETSSETETSEGSTESTETSGSSEGANGEYVTITIQRGNSSYTVAKMLCEAGLVSDAKAYDAYLCKHGYDHHISVGTFQIPIGSSEEEIARIITNAK